MSNVVVKNLTWLVSVVFNDCTVAAACSLCLRASTGSLQGKQRLSDATEVDFASQEQPSLARNKFICNGAILVQEFLQTKL
jgi:hypothetical protein